MYLVCMSVHCEWYKLKDVLGLYVCLLCPTLSIFFSVSWGDTVQLVGGFNLGSGTNATLNCAAGTCVHVFVSVFAGLCIIINNRDFYKDPERADAKQMISREGTDVDRGTVLYLTV